MMVRVRLRVRVSGALVMFTRHYVYAGSRGSNAGGI